MVAAARDAAGVVVGEGPQDQQRAHHFGAVHAAVLDPVGPGLPPLAGLCRRPVHLQRFRHRAERREPGQGQRHALAGADLERSPVPVPVGVQSDAAQDDGVRTRHRDQFGCPLGAALPDPGDGPGVVEANAQVDTEGDRSGDPDHPADQIGALDGGTRVRPDRHEVVHLGHPGRRSPPGHQDERVAVVAADGPGRVVGRSQPPHPVVRIAEQRGEHRRGVEPGQAEPADVTIARHQRRRAAVAQQGEVLDRSHHAPDLGTAAGIKSFGGGCPPVEKLVWPRPSPGRPRCRSEHRPPCLG